MGVLESFDSKGLTQGLASYKIRLRAKPDIFRDLNSP